MTSYDTILEYLDHQKWMERETHQHVIQEMIISCLKESDYLDLCLKYDKMPVIQEGVGSSIKHGVDNAAGSVRSVITRIRALMRRNQFVARTLLSHVTDVIGGIKGKFRKSGSKKSASQIAHENVRKTLDPDKKLAESEARIRVPYTGDVKQDEIALINSSILIKEFDDDDTFMIDTMGVNYVKTDKGKLRAVSDKGEGVKSLASVMLYTNSMIYFVKHKDDLDKLYELINEGFKIINNEGTMTSEEYAKKVSHLTNRANMKLNAVGNSGIKMSMKELREFQQKMSTMAERLDFAQNGNTNLDDVDKNVIRSLNDLVAMIEFIQFGITSLTNAIQKVHLIDLKFMNSIDDREALSKFVYGCVQNGIPPKFVAYNAWLISSENIRGSSAKYKPVGGQTRCVFFPNDNKKEILKIATSGIGINANKNEIRFSEFIKKSGEEDMIKLSALITHTYAEDAIVAMERVVDKVGKHPDLIALREVKSKYQDFTKRHPELRLVVSDFNDGNVMWSSDKDMWVCIDYGLGRRNAHSTKKENDNGHKADVKNT